MDANNSGGREPFHPQWCKTIHSMAKLDWDPANEKHQTILNSALSLVASIERIMGASPHLPVRLTLPNATNTLTLYDGHNVAAEVTVLRFNNIKRWRRLLSCMLGNKGFSMFVDNTCSSTLYLLVELKEIPCD